MAYHISCTGRMFENHSKRACLELCYSNVIQRLKIPEVKAKTGKRRVRSNATEFCSREDMDISSDLSPFSPLILGGLGAPGIRIRGSSRGTKAREKKKRRHRQRKGKGGKEVFLRFCSTVSGRVVTVVEFSNVFLNWVGVPVAWQRKFGILYCTVQFFFLFLVGYGTVRLQYCNCYCVDGVCVCKAARRAPRVGWDVGCGEAYLVASVVQQRRARVNPASIVSHQRPFFSHFLVVSYRRPLFAVVKRKGERERGERHKCKCPARQPVRRTSRRVGGRVGRSDVLLVVMLCYSM